jgi:hypothetical protein
MTPLASPRQILRPYLHRPSTKETHTICWQTSRDCLLADALSLTAHRKHVPWSLPLSILTFVVSEFGWLIGSLSFAMRALYLQTFRRQLRFLGEKIVCECVSYFRMRE